MSHRVADKLSFVLLVAVASLVFDWWTNLIALAALLTLHFSSRSFQPVSPTAARRFRRFQLFIIVLAALMSVVNALLIPGGGTIATAGPVSLHWNGLLFGLRTGSRLAVLTTAMLLFFSSTPIRVVARFLNAAGLPSALVMSLLVSLMFIDQLPRRIDTIFTAQEARGAPVRSNILSRAGAFMSILTPLVLSSIAESTERGMALELRGMHTGASFRMPADAESVEGPTWLTPLFLSLVAFLLLGTLLRWLLT